MNPRITPPTQYPLTPPQVHFVEDPAQTHTECGKPRTEFGTADWAQVTCGKCHQVHRARERAENVESAP